MANKINEEGKYWQELKAQDCFIPEVLWDLMNHHLRNDAQIFMFNTYDLMAAVERLCGDDSLSSEQCRAQLRCLALQIMEISSSLYERSRNIDTFFKALRDNTRGSSQPVSPGRQHGGATP